MRILLCSTLVLMLLASLSISASALNTSFDTEPISKSDYMVYAGDVSLLDKEPERKTFITFDVAKTGSIAVGVNPTGTNDMVISIYKSDGSFDYGIAVNNHRGIVFELFESSISIVDFANEIIFEIDRKGKIIDAGKYVSNKKNNKVYNSLLADERTVGEVTYSATSTFPFSVKKNNITMTDDSKTQTIYSADGSETNIHFSIKWVIVIVLSVCITIWCCYLSVRRHRSNRN